MVIKRFVTTRRGGSVPFQPPEPSVGDLTQPGQHSFSFLFNLGTSCNSKDPVGNYGRIKETSRLSTHRPASEIHVGNTVSLTKLCRI